jgi:hypothetical protein
MTRKQIKAQAARYIKCIEWSDEDFFRTMPTRKTPRYFLVGSG